MGSRRKGALKQALNRRLSGVFVGSLPSTRLSRPGGAVVVRPGADRSQDMVGGSARRNDVHHGRADSGATGAAGVGF